MGNEPLRLSNVWANFEEFMERLRGLGDGTLTWWYTRKLAEIQEGKKKYLFEDLANNLLLNFKNDEGFRAIFDGYDGKEKADILAALLVPSDPKEPERGRGKHFAAFSAKLMKDMDGQEYLGIGFGLGAVRALADPAVTKEKEDWARLVSGLAGAQKRLRERKSQFREKYGRQPLSNLAKQMLKSNQSDVDKILRAMDRFRYNHTGMRLACKAAGLQAAVWHPSGSVKGWGEWSKGYSLSATDYMPEKLDLYGVNKEEYAKVLQNLTAAGFRIHDSDMPSKAINGNTVATIVVEKFRNDPDTIAVQLNENQFEMADTGGSEQAANKSREGNDQFGVCSVCHSELLNADQQREGLCDECS